MFEAYKETTRRERPKSAPYPRLKNSKGLQNFKVLVNWEPFHEKNFLKKVAQCRKTLKCRFGVSGIVCYAGNFFGSVPWANRYILVSSEYFFELLVELFSSVQVVFKKLVF